MVVWVPLSMSMVTELTSLFLAGRTGSMVMWVGVVMIRATATRRIFPFDATTCVLSPFTTLAFV